MPPLGLLSDPCFEEHDTGASHPERPQRLASVRRALDGAGIPQRCRRVELDAADDDLLALVHDRSHIERVDRACAGGELFIDSMDTAISRDSVRIARLAAGSLFSLCRAVQQGQLRGGFAAVRPPGHHAERDLAMGFCLFNNIAVAARGLIERQGLSRVLIVDWDVHHGNGTQHIFEDDPAVFFFSVHQSPLYPGTGARSETGRGAGEGTTLNCPLSPGAGDDRFLAALTDELLPAAQRFAPEFVLISAGFDAHHADPLANLEVSTACYAEATRIVRGLADGSAEGRLVSTLEGGYDLDALSESVVAHVEVLLEEPPAS